MLLDKIDLTNTTTIKALDEWKKELHFDQTYDIDYINRKHPSHKRSEIYFYGHHNNKENDCLSQWYHAPFEIFGHRFETAEHWMMFLPYPV